MVSRLSIRKRISSIVQRPPASRDAGSRLVSQGLHWLGRGAFERSGFKWEVRRSGELKIGLWRRRLREEDPRKRALRRLVIVPGFGDSPLSWLMMGSLLTPVLRRSGYDELLYLDFPGFNGRLFADKCFQSMDALLSAVGDVYDWLQPDTLLGHSLGGWLSARYAVECGQEFRPKVRNRHGYGGPGKLILVAPGGVFENPETRDFTTRLFRDSLGEVGFGALRPHLFAKEPVWFGWIAREFSQFCRDEGIRQFARSVRDDHLLQGQLDQIRAETWLVWGERDTLCPAGGLKRWLDGTTSVPGGGRGVLIKGVGHTPQIEAPAVTAAVLGQILLGKLPHTRGDRWWSLLEAQ